MIRLTLTLMVALWAVLVVWGTPTETEQQATATQTPVATPIVMAADYYSTPTIIGGAPPAPTVTRASAPASIAPAQTQDTGAPASQPETAALPNADLPLYTVTGNRVNLRSGPSTGNEVVGALVFGDVAEGLGDVVDGWVEVRDLTTGQTGFMAARFLDAL